MCGFAGIWTARQPLPKDLLAEPRLREEGLFDPGPIRRAWAEHLSGRRNWEHALWVILMFRLWKECWRPE